MHKYPLTVMHKYPLTPEYALLLTKRMTNTL